MALAHDVPAAWNAPSTDARTKQRLTRLVIQESWTTVRVRTLREPLGVPAFDPVVSQPPLAQGFTVRAAFADTIVVSLASTLVGDQAGSIPFAFPAARLERRGSGHLVAADALRATGVGGGMARSTQSDGRKPSEHRFP
jgi:hypothetical protein